MTLILLSWLCAAFVHAAPTAQVPMSSSCRDATPASPDSNGTSMICTIISDKLEREYRIYIPSGYDANTPTSLIISYHGADKNMLNQEILSQFSNETINPTMIAVYPNGEFGIGTHTGKRVWEGAPYANSNISDKVFTTDLIADVKFRYNIDPKGIFGTGKSNGGGFLDTLACSPEHGGDFAAFAAASGAFYTDTGSQPCHPAHPLVPFLEFHGLNDSTIPYIGRDHSSRDALPAIPDWLALWAGRDQCVEPPTTTVLIPGDPRNVTHVSYDCGGKAGLVQHYQIGGMGHDWPSTVENSDNRDRDGPTLIDASPLIVAVFGEVYKTFM